MRHKQKYFAREASKVILPLPLFLPSALTKQEDRLKREADRQLADKALREERERLRQAETARRSEEQRLASEEAARWGDRGSWVTSMDGGRTHPFSRRGRRRNRAGDAGCGSAQSFAGRPPIERMTCWRTWGSRQRNRAGDGGLRLSGDILVTSPACTVFRVAYINQTESCLIGLESDPAFRGTSST